MVLGGRGEEGGRANSAGHILDSASQILGQISSIRALREVEFVDVKSLRGVVKSHNDRFSDQLRQLHDMIFFQRLHLPKNVV